MNWVRSGLILANVVLDFTALTLLLNHVEARRAPGEP
jgi:hypothetical protein